jgi:cytoskeletal protein CcmA (bactofilin family)
LEKKTRHSDLSVSPQLKDWPGQTLSEETRVKGIFICNEDLFFNASLEGTLSNDNATSVLIIGPKAKIKGKIIAHRVVVHGYVEGDIYAHELVHLSSMAFVTGKVIAQKLKMDFGAVIQGESRTGIKPNYVKAAKDVGF